MELVMNAPGEVSLRHCVCPSNMAADEVLLEVKRLSLCGSDYRLFEGSYSGPKRYPIRFGHEWSGCVVGALHGSRFPVGTRVTGDCSRWCGECTTCKLDKNLCEEIEKYGITLDGFSTKYRTVPSKYLYADEFGLCDELLALTELFAVALRAVNKVRRQLAQASSVLIIGAGAVGLATFLLLKHECGIGNVEIAEVNPMKAAGVLRRMAGCRVLGALKRLELDTKLSYMDVVLDARYPIIFECSGAATALNSAILSCGMGGTIVCVGIAPPAIYRMDLVVTKGLTMMGSIGGTGEFHDAIRFIAKHRRFVLPIVTHEFVAEHAQEAFETTATAAERIKTQLVF